MLHLSTCKPNLLIFNFEIGNFIVFSRLLIEMNVTIFSSFPHEAELFTVIANESFSVNCIVSLSTVSCVYVYVVYFTLLSCPMPCLPGQTELQTL